MKMATSIILHVLVVCVLVGQVTGQTQCSTTADCSNSECCYTMSMLDGKRQVWAQSTCRPLGKLHDSCLMMYTDRDGSRVYYQCPCEPGLVCKPDGGREIPLGETGTCEHP